MPGRHAVTRWAVACGLVVMLGACARACGKQEVASRQAPKPAAAPAPPPPPPKPVTADDLPPVASEQGEGIEIALAPDGRVKLKTNSLWNAPLDAVYDNCDYYRKALPVIREQVSADRAKVLDKMCVPPEPPKAKAKTKAKTTTPAPKRKPQGDRESAAFSGRSP